MHKFFSATTYQFIVLITLLFQSQICHSNDTIDSSAKNLETLLEVSSKKLTESTQDYKKLGALAVSFVARVNGIEIDEKMWPKVANFIRDLDKAFSVATNGEKPAEKALEAITELREFLKHGDANFSQPENKKTEQPAAPANQSQETPTQTHKEHVYKPLNNVNFDLDEFIIDAKEDLKLVSDAEEFKFIAESMLEIMEKKTLGGNEQKRFSSFLKSNFTPLAEEHGVDKETQEKLADFYKKFEIELPTLKILPTVTARTPEDDQPSTNQQEKEIPTQKTDAIKINAEAKKSLEKKLAQIMKENPLPTRKTEEDAEKYIQTLQKYVTSLHEHYENMIKNL